MLAGVQSHICDSYSAADSLGGTGVSGVAEDVAGVIEGYTAPQSWPWPAVTRFSCVHKEERLNLPANTRAIANHTTNTSLTPHFSLTSDDTTDGTKNDQVVVSMSATALVPFVVVCVLCCLLLLLLLLDEGNCMKRSVFVMRQVIVGVSQYTHRTAS